MNKNFLTLIIGGLFFIGCANSQQEPQPQTKSTTQTVKKVVETAKKVLNPCERDKMACLTQCNISYPTAKDDLKLKACIAKCYTLYAGCKTAEGAKKGYEKTKEISKKVYENTKDFINEHKN